jgi:site-specific recombinase XerD
MLPEIERFLKFLRRKAPGTSTCIHYTSDVRLFFAWLGKAPAEVTLRDVDAFIEHGQAANLAVATINRRLAALRAFYQSLALEADDAPANPVHPKRHFIRQGERLPRDLQDDTVQRLLAVISRTRDKAMLLPLLHSARGLGAPPTIRSRCGKHLTATSIQRCRDHGETMWLRSCRERRVRSSAQVCYCGVQYLYIRKRMPGGALSNLVPKLLQIRDKLSRL